MNSFSLFLEIYKVILVVCFTRKYILVSLNLGIARNLEANDTAFTDYYWTETVSFRTTVERYISGTPNITPSPEVKCNLGLVARLEIASLFFPIDWKGSLKKTALRKYGFGNFTGLVALEESRIFTCIFKSNELYIWNLLVPCRRMIKNSHTFKSWSECGR